MVIHALPRVENPGTSAPSKPRSDAASLQSGLEGLSIEGEPYVSTTVFKRAASLVHRMQLWLQPSRLV